MTIEVRQLVIRSSVGEEAANTQDAPAESPDGKADGQVADRDGGKEAREDGDECFDAETFRREILAECRQLFRELLCEQRER